MVDDEISNITQVVELPDSWPMQKMTVSFIYGRIKNCESPGVNISTVQGDAEKTADALRTALGTIISLV